MPKRAAIETIAVDPKLESSKAPDQQLLLELVEVPDQQLLLKIDKAAKMLSTSRSTIYKLNKRTDSLRLPIIHFNRAAYIATAELEAWVERLRHHQYPPSLAKTA